MYPRRAPSWQIPLINNGTNVTLKEKYPEESQDYTFRHCIRLYKKFECFEDPEPLCLRAYFITYVKEKEKYSNIELF